MHWNIPTLLLPTPCLHAVYRSSRKTLSTDTIGENDRQTLQGCNGPPSLTPRLYFLLHIKHFGEEEASFSKGSSGKGGNNGFFIGCYPVLLLCSRLSRFFLGFATRGWKQRRKQQPSGFVVAALLCNNCVQASAVDSIFPAWRQDNEGDLSCSRFISKSFCAHLCLVWVVVHAQSYLTSESLHTCAFVDDNKTVHIAHVWESCS